MGPWVRSGLNVDLEYYSQNNVNIVIMLTSDGEEYLSRPAPHIGGGKAAGLVPSLPSTR